MSATPGVTKPSAKRFALRVLKLGISCVYFVFERASELLLRKPRTASCVILYYHSVPAAYRSQFERQMMLIADRGIFTDLYSLDKLPEGQRRVAITFDDALATFAENAVPVLLKHKVPATVFVVTDCLGTKPEFGESYYSADERIMSVEQLRALPALISVGSHTLTHPNLTELAAADAAREIGESRQRLASLLDRDVRWFCFPYGACNASTTEQCRAAGYERVFTTEPKPFTPGSGEFAVGRFEADPWDWPLEFRMKIAGAYRWEPWARAWKRRLLGRQSQPNPSKQAPAQAGPAGLA